MVQFHDRVGRRPLGRDDYWKLDTGDNLTSYGLRDKMEEKNFRMLKTGNNARLRVLYVRCQRGLMSYEGLSRRELLRYAKDRGVKVIYVPKATKTTIKAQLEQADEDATFNRFTDLPPEIRQIIFQHYFDSLVSTEKTYNKYQPPLTRTSRMLRQETLPLFYDSYDMRLDSWGSVHTPYRVQWFYTTSNFLQSIPAHDIARVKSVQMCFCNLEVDVTIDLLNKDDPVSKIDIVREGLRSWQPSDASRAIRQQLSSALRTCTIVMAARQGPLKFRLSDVQDLGEIVRSIIGSPT